MPQPAGGTPALPKAHVGGTFLTGSAAILAAAFGILPNARL